MTQNESRDEQWIRKLVADVQASDTLISGLDWKRSQDDCATISDDVWLCCLLQRIEEMEQRGIRCEPVEHAPTLPFTGNVEISDVLLKRC